MRASLCLAFFCAIRLTAETEHKDKAADCPFHGMAGNVGIGADYLVHSIPAGSQTFFARDYLVVEVAVFPAFAQPVTIDGNTFKLRLNGQKFPLSSVAPGFVAASLKYPDWEQHTNAEVSAGVGDTGVILGRPPLVGRFPGDPIPSQTRLPRSPRAPSADQLNGVEREAPESAEDAIARTSLVEGRAGHPVSGFLYFLYKGNVKSLKSVELIYQSKEGPVALKLL